MPGGFVTFDELFEALTLVQTKKVTSFPIVLFGTAYWSPLLDWVRDSAVAGGYVSDIDLGLVTLTDSVDEVIRAVTGVRGTGNGT